MSDEIERMRRAAAKPEEFLSNKFSPATTLLAIALRAAFIDGLSHAIVATRREYPPTPKQIAALGFVMGYALDFYENLSDYEHLKINPKQIFLDYLEDGLEVARTKADKRSVRAFDELDALLKKIRGGHYD